MKVRTHLGQAYVPQIPIAKEKELAILQLVSAKVKVIVYPNNNNV
jgi:hypothetical protein